MGLFDSVIGALGQQGQAGGLSGGHAGGHAGGQAGGLAGGLAGGQGALMAVVMAVLQSQGGLAGLLQKFQASGLGDVAQSWISQGQNQPVSGEQLHKVLDPETVAQVSQHLGMSPTDAMSQLSKYLPQVVDMLSPNGQVPDDGQGGLGNMNSMSGMLAGLFK